MRRVNHVLFAMLFALLAAGLAAPTATMASNGKGNSPEAQSCKQDGWQSVETADGVAFKNQGDCVSYVVQGGILDPIALAIAITFDNTSDPNYCFPIVHVTDFAPNTTYSTQNLVNGFAFSAFDVTTNSTGDVTYGAGYSYYQGFTNVFQAVVGDVASDVVDIAC